ncbi:aldo/keto reductase [Candidatus Woesebacteria bacterium]|nr:aldo/keto reductase [Candidatus Woesebacteria bacterium]MCD8507782.1 aldo/keto reductase [Candidatus Woesebacteria bacterium]MCD8526969.1 aldo/keto reductase [Candidatus Woesebacteria bacterium]MCD8545860.1 aldo/keto reductase [Candidatus Woesebacteria bacterium]
MQPTLTLNNGKTIPQLGLGTWKSETASVGEAVKIAVRAGYRHIDCAHIYGNEAEIGTALQELFTNGEVKREELFITSKLWNTDHHPDTVAQACRRTLENLQLEYLDLYLVHWGIAFAAGEEKEPHGEDGRVKTEAVSLQETWRAMEQLVEEDLVKSIGVANYTAPLMVDLLNYATLKPAMNQIEIHPYNAQLALVEFCHDKNVAVTAYSPLGSFGERSEKPLVDPVVVDIATAHGVTPAQVLIRWSLQRGLVVIPKSTNPNRIAENFAVFAFTLTDEEMNRLNALDRGHRFVDPSEWWGVPYFG